MNVSDQIPVPTDGSECAGRAADHAIDLAAGSDATLRVLSVIDATRVARSAPPVNTDHVEREFRSRAESAVAEVAVRAADAGVDTVTAVEPGVPGRDIAGYAAEYDCDLIVMGTRGRSGLERYLPGSVAERTVRRSAVPVVTVRTDAAEQA